MGRRVLIVWFYQMDRGKGERIKGGGQKSGPKGECDGLPYRRKDWVLKTVRYDSEVEDQGGVGMGKIF